MEHVTRARSLFKIGYSCAQAIAGAFCEEMGLSFEQAIKLTSSFGGGMGGLREYCGAVSAAYMVVGMVKGYTSPNDLQVKTDHYKLVREIAGKFSAIHGTCNCRELLASLPAKLEANPLPRTEEYYKIRPCVYFVETSAKILDEILYGNPQNQSQK